MLRARERRLAGRGAEAGTDETEAKPIFSERNGLLAEDPGEMSRAGSGAPTGEVPSGMDPFIRLAGANVKNIVVRNREERGGMRRENA